MRIFVACAIIVTATLGVGGCFDHHGKAVVYEPQKLIGKHVKSYSHKSGIRPKQTFAQDRSDDCYVARMKPEPRVS